MIDYRNPVGEIKVEKFEKIFKDIINFPWKNDSQNRQAFNDLFEDSLIDFLSRNNSPDYGKWYLYRLTFI